MNELLNNFYGIYPTWIENNIFQFQNQRFCLVDCYLSEKQLCQLLEINQLVINRMGQGGYLPIKNMQRHFLTNHQVVFQINEFPVSLETFFMPHYITLSSHKTLVDVRERWIEKVEFVQKRFAYEVDCHQNHYAFKMTLIEYHIGMAKTAIGILNDLIYDYPGGVALNMVCHRRIHTLDFKNCMYPMNFIMDNRARDLSELFLHGLIDENEVMHCFEQQGYTPAEMLYFFCRLLYPVWFFDLIEEAYFLNKESLLDDAYFCEQMDKHLVAIKKIYMLLTRKIHLKPLNW